MDKPKTAAEWFELGVSYRKEQRWGDAINAFNKSRELEPSEVTDATIDSIYQILRFVNKDLMNP